MSLSVGIYILEQLIARNVLTPLYNSSESPIMELNGVIFARLATELEPEVAPVKRNVSIPQGRQAK
jgi:hypothetical protein